uniref:type II secretion system protein n=1 Tax=Ningiella ruwaisensis TaxID=2364274 RepID=UPI00109F6B64|nr:type II secretion system protein [Ningiella ruwaisensis]
MNKQRGFTLIELVIVIVILGILAVTAAPRFIDIQSDARAGALQGVKGALQGSSQLVFAKAAIKGVQKVDNSDTANSFVSVAGVEVQTHFGYPDAAAYSGISSSTSGSTTVPGIDSFVDINDDEFTLEAIAASGTNPAAFRLRFERDAATVACYAEYINAAGVGQVPTVNVVTTGC